MAKTPEKWEVDDEAFWASTGKKIATRNLIVSIPNLLCGFAVWLYWGVMIVRMQKLHDYNPAIFAFAGWNDGVALTGDAYKGLLYTLPAVAGLMGATLRIPNSFMIAICGGRNVKFMTTFLLILPALGAGIALQNPETPFYIYIILASLSGIGGGAFASSMSNISFFFPKRMQGLSLGLNAGIGNFGVSVMQFLIPAVITFGLFGGLGGDPYSYVQDGVEHQMWIQNGALVWVPIMAFFALCAFLFMNNLPQHKCGSTPAAIGKFLWLQALGFVAGAIGVILLVTDWGVFPVLLKIFVILAIAVAIALALMRFATPKAINDSLMDQFAIFRNKHTWVMTWLYVMTFGSFIGYAASFPKLIKDVFGYIRIDSDGNPIKVVLEGGQSATVTLASGSVVDIVNKTSEVITYTSVVNPAAYDALSYAFLGAGVGALIRPFGGWLSDKFGGARVTQYDTWLMVAATIASGYFVSQAYGAENPNVWFVPFLLTFILLFATTGIGNGSTFRMIPIIFPKHQAGPVLGWTSAIAAYGAFLIPKIFATQIEAGTPEYALYGFAGYYSTCLLVNWWFYARKNAEIPC